MSDAMHWSRWGDPDHHSDLPPGAIALVQAAFGGPAARPAVRREEARLPASELDGDVASHLRAALGGGAVDTGDAARLGHTRGRSTADLLTLRSGDAAAAPDAVLRPGSHEEVMAALQVAGRHRLAVVPYGGGTSVVGGLTEQRRPFVALDLARLDGLIDLDEISMTATLEAGVTGPAAERLLGEHGLTLGHFPQSFEYATVGGFAATRSSGQSSSGYGRFDQMVVGLRVATPAGTWMLGSAPASAAGPDLRQLVLGSEGALGVITGVRLAVRRAPEVRRYEGWRLADFGAGRQALRTLAQADLQPTVLRLSDETETALNLSDPSAIGNPGYDGVLMITGYEGTAPVVDRMRREVREVLIRLGATPLGDEPGKRWEQGRFAAPYLRDTLLDAGVVVETLETATFWSDLPGLLEDVRSALDGALRADGATPVVLCHISHVYRTGASLYFTVAFDAGEDPLARWRAAKTAAGDAIRRCGATITHHHAVGRDHLRWFADEIGPHGRAVLRAVKSALDPEGILNPGVLIP